MGTGTDVAMESAGVTLVKGDLLGVAKARELSRATMRNIRESLDKMAGGMTPVIDSVYPIEDFREGLERLESRKVFGKVVVTL